LVGEEPTAVRPERPLSVRAFCRLCGGAGVWVHRREPVVTDGIQGEVYERDPHLCVGALEVALEALPQSTAVRTLEIGELDDLDRRVRWALAGSGFPDRDANRRLGDDLGDDSAGDLLGMRRDLGVTGL